MRTGLKMAGAKGPSMMAQILPRLPQVGAGWVVPFFGVGAAARAMAPRGEGIAWAGDANPHLVAVLRGLQADPEDFLRRAQVHAEDALAGLDADAQRAWYADARARYNAGEGDPALFLVIWRTAFNGLMRFSRAGAFNAPSGIQPGKPRAKILDVGDLRGHALWLARLPPIQLAGYEEAPEGPAYLDPPYAETHSAYTAGGFDHARYHAWLAERPGPWAASNSPAALERFPDAYEGAQIYEVSRAGVVSRRADGRGPQPEILAVRL